MEILKLFNFVERKNYGKKELVAKLLAAKEASGKTYDEIAEPLGYCNVQYYL